MLRKVLGGLFLPSTAIFHWLEDHAQIRLSILLTYLFGESILFVHLLTWLDRAWTVAGYAHPSASACQSVLGVPTCLLLPVNQRSWIPRQLFDEIDQALGMS